MTVDALKGLSLVGQIDCVRREIVKRRSAYPRMVASGKLRQGQAEYEIAAMERVLATLEWLARHETTVRLAIDAEKAAERQAATSGILR